MKHFLFICALSFVVSSCSKQDELLLGEVPFTIIYEESYSLITEADTWVIKNEFAWEEFKFHSFTDYEFLQDIDFNSHIILAVSQGQKPTGGYSISISNIFEFENHLEVNISEDNPLPNQEVTLAFTQPFQIVMIEKTEKTILFN